MSHDLTAFYQLLSSLSKAYSRSVFPLIDLRCVAYDLIWFMQVFDLVHTWYVFVCNSVFNGTMFQGVKFRVECDAFELCSLRFDLFHEGFLLGLNLVYRCPNLVCLYLNLDCLCLNLIYHCPNLE